MPVKYELDWFVIGPMTIEETKLLLTMHRCGRGRVFMVEEKSVCKFVYTPTLKLVTERGGYMRKMVKVKCTLRVTLNHLYIGAEIGLGIG